MKRGGDLPDVDYEERSCKNSCMHIKYKFLYFWVNVHRGFFFINHPLKEYRVKLKCYIKKRFVLLNLALNRNKNKFSH